MNINIKEQFDTDITKHLNTDNFYIVNNYIVIKVD